ncbi:MAG: hypothetical protein M3340_17155 [Actinomycetota bacterium]|nr:hypothetical protein [Actinomycetota bacterium]
MSGNMRKCISLGPAGQGGANNQFAYSFEPSPGDFPNRRFFAETNTKWIRLWADWKVLQPASTTPLDGSNTVLAHLDKEIRRANEDGLKVMLVMYRVPTWVAAANQYGAPDNVSTTGPWGNWLRFLYGRYKGDAFPRIHILEVVNEPNYQFLQRTDTVAKVISMFRTATSISQEHTHKLFLGGPALADAPAGTLGATHWPTFMDQMAATGFRAHSKFIWTHHNYGDVEDNSGSTVGARDRVGWWTGYDEGEGPIVFGSEGGGRMARLGGNEITQRDRVVSKYNNLKGQRQIGMQSNYLMMDPAANDYSGLRRPYETGGAPRAVYSPWGGLDRGWDDLSYFQHRATLSGWTMWDPTILSRHRGHLEVFAIGLDRQIYNNWTLGNGWSGWGHQGGQVNSAPGAIAINDTSMNVFVAGGDNQLWGKFWDINGGWSAWFPLGGAIAGDPAVGSWNGDHLEVFVRWGDGTLWHRWWTRSGGWSTWFQLRNETVNDAPSAVSWASGRMDVVWRNGSNIRHMWHDNGWRGPGTLGAPGGEARGAPEIVSWNPGRLDVICRGGDWRLWRKVFDRGNWTDWEPILGTEDFQFSPGAVSPYPGQIDLIIQRNEHINHLSL